MVDLEIVRSRIATLAEMLSILKRHQRLSLKTYTDFEEFMRYLRDHLRLA